MVDKNDPSLIVWNGYNRKSITTKKLEEWDKNDPNLDCLFIQWDGSFAIKHKTDACDSKAFYLCQKDTTGTVKNLKWQKITRNFIFISL